MKRYSLKLGKLLSYPCDPWSNCIDIVPNNYKLRVPYDDEDGHHEEYFVNTLYHVGSIALANKHAKARQAYMNQPLFQRNVDLHQDFSNIFKAVINSTMPPNHIKPFIGLCEFNEPRQTFFSIHYIETIDKWKEYEVYVDVEEVFAYNKITKETDIYWIYDGGIWVLGGESLGSFRGIAQHESLAIGYALKQILAITKQRIPFLYQQLIHKQVPIRGPFGRKLVY